MSLTIYSFFRSKFCRSLIDHLFKYQKLPTRRYFLCKLSKKGVVNKIIHKHKAKPHSKLESTLYLHLRTHISHDH